MFKKFRLSGAPVRREPRCIIRVRVRLLWSAFAAPLPRKTARRRSPADTAAHKIRRLGRKSRSGIDRTPHKTDRKISFVSYDTRSISMNITRAEAWQLHKAVNTAKGDLCRHRDRNPTGGA